MSTVDIAHLREWVGNSQTDHDTLSSRHARLMAATLGLPQSDLVEGAALPPLWHWLYFLGGESPAALGRDGHPARGGFLPPVTLPNRMWAGGQLEFYAPAPLDARIEKRSTVVAVDHKQGRRGELVFVKVLHELLHEGDKVLSELHDIVYKGVTATGSGAADVRTPVAQHSRRIKPDSTMLFRYSALTFNGHRIHYDADYCREVEGYPNLVIHGPLNATLLAAFAEEVGGKPVREFRYRGLKPSILGNELTINAARDGDQLVLWVALPDGSTSMRAEATF
ncbi:MULTISPECIES: acyl-CoA dehydrogenase [Paraburkholderia]|uniref:acyl-CoA dehydrogenase n=1 Tax=Paraburkholderia TaxID=1822464 RepID=UPI0006B51A42|nr:MULTISPECIES: acyl-CoA dehydrogenase [Paraburkholderia]KPD15749.1 acyl-CoA dehydrogenase [Burkholderia sp. ST111]MBK5153497.1 acyl-CoA dehydrogenase [Burkholderia sp. R-69608]MBK5185584.1 acyl-CoA dehydrogenase [Burkholderia sp. R-69749]CAE6881073.1 Mesaconyl-C(4)-CoA hydratase [Paraburkholderia domus]CAE6972337.1 Mesaconyl-C(4)-CoA hydratase [Paraburkholderia nemoris]